MQNGGGGWEKGRHLSQNEHHMSCSVPCLVLYFCQFFFLANYVSCKHCILFPSFFWQGENSISHTTEQSCWRGVVTAHSLLKLIHSTINMLALFVTALQRTNAGAFLCLSVTPHGRCLTAPLGTALKKPGVFCVSCCFIATACTWSVSEIDGSRPLKTKPQCQ